MVQSVPFHKFLFLRGLTWLGTVLAFIFSSSLPYARCIYLEKAIDVRVVLIILQ